MKGYSRKERPCPISATQAGLLDSCLSSLVRSHYINKMIAPLPEVTRVCVIGAGGVSGLTSLAQLLSKGVPAERIVGFEARPTAGGVW